MNAELFNNSTDSFKIGYILHYLHNKPSRINGLLIYEKAFIIELLNKEYNYLMEVEKDMDAKKCDRCGTYYEAAKFSGQRQIVEFKGRLIDLCPACLKELGDWFESALKDSKVKEETLKELVEKLLPEVPVFKRGRVYNNLIRFFDIRSDTEEGMVNELYYKAKSVDTNVPGAFTTYRNIGMETSSLMCIFLDRFYKSKPFKEETIQC